MLVAKLIAGCPGEGRRVVRRQDAEPVGPAARARAARRPDRRRPSPRVSSASPSAARRWAASSPPAGPAAPRACGPRSAGSAATAACRWPGRWTRSARSPARSRTARSSSTPSTATTGSTRPPSISRSPGRRRSSLQGLKIGYMEDPERPFEQREGAEGPARPRLRARPDRRCPRSTRSRRSR